MIRIETGTPEFINDIAEVVRLFLDGVDISEGADEGETIYHRHSDSGGEWVDTFSFRGREYTGRAAAVRGGLAEKKYKKRAIKTACFLLLREVTGVAPPWGSLTGIRPTRVMYELLADGHSPAGARERLERDFYLRPDKAGLLSDIVDMQRGYIDPPEQAFDLYIGIPFCTTRCAYCSFASEPIGRGELIQPYVEALLRELKECAAMVREAGYGVRAAYVGGGTPTALPARELTRIVGAAMYEFPGASEWTVEAGRPDTITPDKLAALRELGVGRISVNPQTFNDATLQRIGRRHTAGETVAAYEMARSAGFEDINMDIIAALPGEDGDDFMRTVDRCTNLAPESVTVHTLAIKRSSRLRTEEYVQTGAEVASGMVDFARARLTSAGYRPYYLYRQKYMAGNLENVGYALPGRACAYNIDHMEETTPILALGAGAITKWIYRGERRIERAPNVKNVGEYIARVDEMIERKRSLLSEGCIR